MKYYEKVLAFIGKWLNDVQTKPGGYAIAYDYKHDPQKLTFYRAYKSYNETMAESVFAPSWEAYLDDDVLEKEVTDALNKLKEKVDRWHACKKVDRIVDCTKDHIADDMESAETISTIQRMLESSQLLPWQKEVLGVVIKAMEEKM